MKKIAAVLLSLILICMPALATQGTGYPAYDGSAAIQNAMGGQFGQEMLYLEFDPGAEYSYLKDGYIQGCFFAFDAAEEYYLELYMLIPQNIQPGDVLTPQSSFASGADSCSITLFEVDEDNQEQAWFAGQLLGGNYPANSSFSIAIESVEASESTISVRGSIQAELCALEGDRPGKNTLAINAAFDFALPLSNEAPAETPAPAAPKENITAPAFTLPPDYIVL